MHILRQGVGINIFKQSCVFGFFNRFGVFFFEDTGIFPLGIWGIVITVIGNLIDEEKAYRL